MNLRMLFMLPLLTPVLLVVAGCDVARSRENLATYMEDLRITVAIKSRFIGSQGVEALGVRVETLNGVVLLSGVAKTPTERKTAENLVWKINGVASIRNEIAVHP